MRVLALVLPLASSISLASLVTLASSCGFGDVALPDTVTPADVVGLSANDLWVASLGSEPGGAFIDDARFTKVEGGATTSLDTIGICRGRCRSFGAAGDGLLAFDHADDGILLVGKAGVVETLAFPDEEPDSTWIVDGRNGVLVAASDVRVYRRDGAAWVALPELDGPVRSVAVGVDGLVTARRDVVVEGEVEPQAKQPATLVGDEWVGHVDIPPQALVAHAADGSVVASTSVAVPAADAFVPLLMFARGLLGARLEGGALDAVLVPLDGGAPEPWASLGRQEQVNAASFRANVLDDGSVAVLYPGAPRDVGVGPKSVLHVAAAP